MSIALYYQTWSDPWTSVPSTMKLAKISVDFPEVTIVNIAFALPNPSYVKGQKTFVNTGLNFSQDFSVVVNAINILKAKGIIVMLSVGGGDYWSSPTTFNATAVVSLMEDLGCDGIDIDWEVGVSDAPSLTNAIYQLKITRRCPKISFAGFSTGAYGPDTDTYKGMNIPAMIAHGDLVDWINIMSYDAGTQYDPLGAFTCYRIYYNGPLLLGIEPGTQSWGSKIITSADVESMCNWVLKDKHGQGIFSSIKDGIFIWSNDKDTTGSPTVAEITAQAKKILTLTTPPISTIPPVPPSQKTSTTHISCPNCDKDLQCSLFFI